MATSVLAARDATWRERSATYAVFLVLGLGAGTWAAAIPAIKASLGLSAGQLSIALLVLAISSITASLLTGAVATQLGTGRATGWAAAFCVVAFMSPALARTYAELLGCAVLMGVSLGATDIAMNAHASDIERRWRQAIMSSFHAGFSLGGLAGAALGGLIASSGAGLPAQIVGPMLLGGAAILAAFPALGTGARAERGQGVALALPERRALPICAIALLCFLLEGAVADWSALYLTSVAGASTAAAAAGYAAFSVTMAVGRTVGDLVVRRLGSIRTLMAGSVVAAVGMALVLVVPEPLAGALGFALVGVGAANIVPVAFSRASNYGATPSAGVAMVATCGYAGFLGGPPLVGIAATWGGLRVAMAVVLLIPLVMMLAALRVDPDDSR